MTAALPTTTALAPWYGSNRILAKHVGEELAGCTWVGVPFAGGLCELACIDARTIVANDLHRHVMNLASVAADPVLGPKLYRHLRRVPHHPVALHAAQQRCAEREARMDGHLGLWAPETNYEGPDLGWAIDYFMAAWMSRNGCAGTSGEFRTGLSFRWDANGGDSATRFRSATSSLIAWRRILQRASFTTLDAFEFLGKCKDRTGHGIYVDAPWPDAGDGYKHPFGETQQRRLAQVLAGFQAARVVVRFGAHPLIRELYPADRWTITERTSRAQSNGAVAELLIINQKARNV